YLDWKLFARSDRYYIKRFEDETNLRCHLVLDTSRSMGYGTIGYTKIEYARTAAATIAYFLATQRDAVGLVTFEDPIPEYLPPPPHIGGGPCPSRAATPPAAPPTLPTRSRSWRRPSASAA